MCSLSHVDCSAQQVLEMSRPNSEDELEMMVQCMKSQVPPNETWGIRGIGGDPRFPLISPRAWIKRNLISFVNHQYHTLLLTQPTLNQQYSTSITRTRINKPSIAQSTQIVFQPLNKAQRVVQDDYAIRPVQIWMFRIPVNMYT